MSAKIAPNRPLKRAKPTARRPEAPGHYDDPAAVRAYVESSRKWPVRGVEDGFVGDFLAQCPTEAPLNVLDVGTGGGHIAVELAARRRNWRVTGLDASPIMLTHAKAWGEKRGVRVSWTCASAEETPFVADRFDAIVSHFAFHEFQDPAAALREMVRLLRPGGALWIQDLERPPTWLFRLQAAGGRLAHLTRPEMARQYEDSVRASYTGKEIRTLLSQCRLVGETTRTYSFGAGSLWRACVTKAEPADGNPPTEASRVVG